MDKRIKIVQVGFEMTRRCNMNCNFCSRGDTQNIDISKEIIDKSLDELKNFDIGILRFHGGEPLLTPDMIEYIVNGIIEREINVNQCAFFSNGTILNPIIKSSLDKIGKYCNEKSDTNLSIYMDHFIKAYKGINAPCSIIVSDYGHERVDFEKFKEFYNSKYVEVYIQKEHFIGDSGDAISIEGRAKENLQYFIDEGCTKLNIFDNKNKFCIINDMFEYEFGEISIDKGISISSNGNVYVGCNQSYKELDKENICNIFQCNGNLYEKIDTWCWKYPLHKNQQDRRYSLKSIMFRYEKGIENNDWINGEKVDKKAYDFINMIVTFYEKLEEYIIKYHKLYPMMNHFELQKLVMYEFAKGTPDEYRKYIMPLLSIYKDKDENGNKLYFSDSECDMIIDKIKESIIKKHGIQ